MRTLLEYGLANVVAATALAVVALLVGLVVRRPAVRNALWILVFVRLLLPPLWTVPLPNFDYINREKPGLPVAVSDTTYLRDTSHESKEIAPAGPIPQPGDYPAADNLLAVFPVDPITESTVSAAEVSPAMPPVLETSFPSLGLFVVLLGSCWLAGSLFVFARSARRIVDFRRALNVARPAPEPIQHQAELLARAMGLKRCPPVLLVPGRVWPSLWMPGFSVRRSKLILPSGLLPLLDADQRAAVLAHELAHLRRGDPWVRWLELICCGLYWWYPLLGYFRRQLHESEEQCCDMRVVAALSGRKSYATALVETAFFLDGSAPIPQPMLAATFNGE